jgi:hypothetical protein
MSTVSSFYTISTCLPVHPAMAKLKRSRAEPCANLPENVEACATDSNFLDVDELTDRLVNNGDNGPDSIYTAYSFNYYADLLWTL